MDDPNDFFGDVFQDPEDDPLLEGDAPDDAPDGEPSSSRDGASARGTPSWMADEPDSQRANGSAPSGPSSDDASDEANDPERREIVVDQRAGRGLDALNEAVAQGWRLIRISLAQADGPAEEQRAAERFVAILEPDNPQSLFDFGPGS
jgi:hypothetical protein